MTLTMGPHQHTTRPFYRCPNLHTFTNSSFLTLGIPSFPISTKTLLHKTMQKKNKEIDTHGKSSVLRRDAEGGGCPHVSQRHAAAHSALTGEFPNIEKKEISPPKAASWGPLPMTSGFFNGQHSLRELQPATYVVSLFLNSMSASKGTTTASLTTQCHCSSGQLVFKTEHLVNLHPQLFVQVLVHRHRVCGFC